MKKNCKNVTDKTRIFVGIGYEHLLNLFYRNIFI